MEKITINQLTPHQHKVLRECASGIPIRHLSTLKKLAKLGVVRLHEDTGMIVWYHGNRFAAFYIDEAATFEVEGAGVFCEKYFPGFFAPHLIKVEQCNV